MYRWNFTKNKKSDASFDLTIYLNSSDKISYLAAGGPKSPTISFEEITSEEIPFMIKKIMDVVEVYSGLKIQWEKFVVEELLDL